MHLAGSEDVEEPGWLACGLKLVFRASGESQRLRAAEIDGAVIQLFAIVNRNGDQTAGSRLAGFAGPLEDGYGAKDGLRLFGFGDQAGILSEGGDGRGDQCNAGRTPARRQDATEPGQ